MIETGVLKTLIEKTTHWSKFETKEDEETITFLISTIKNMLEIPKSIPIV